jgi:predicted transcriptional regulator
MNQMAELTFPWEKQAMNGDEMPEDLTLEEQLAYQALAHLYARFRLKQIDRDKGHAEKGKIKHAYEKQSRAAQINGELAKHHVAVLKALEGAATDYAKNRNLETADRMYQALYGMLPSPATEVQD